MSISKTVFDERRYCSFWGDTRLNKQGDMENMIINLHTHIQTHTHTGRGGQRPDEISGKN